MTILTGYHFFRWRWTGGTAVEQIINRVTKRLKSDQYLFNMLDQKNCDLDLLEKTRVFVMEAVID
jgi:hypothetical protein